MPAILSNLYTLAEEIHSYNTRYKHFARTPAFHLNISEQTINFTGAKIWNFLVEQDIDINCSIHFFKRRVKIVLHSNEVDFLWLWNYIFIFKKYRWFYEATKHTVHCTITKFCSLKFTQTSKFTLSGFSIIPGTYNHLFG